jgi:hypothetical protein
VSLTVREVSKPRFMQRSRALGGLSSVRLALVISAVVHVCVLGFAVRAGSSLQAPGSSPTQLPDPPPLDVVLLETPTPVAVATRGTDGLSHATPSHSHKSISKITAPAVSPGPEVGSPHPAPGSHYLSMRGPLDRLDELPASSSSSEAGAWSPEPGAERAPSAKPTGELKQHGRHMTSDHETFGARVDRDGTAHFTDKPDVDVHIGCLFGGCKMGLDDALMRSHGIDPYASAKRQWLEKTFDERAAIGLANRKEDLARSAEFMQRNVTWMWKRTRDAAERKEALFELWDDCAEAGDSDLVSGGASARDYVVGFVRAHLPEGSPGAFTADELAKLNAHRHSRTTFDPYNAPSATTAPAALRTDTDVVQSRL